MKRLLCLLFVFSFPGLKAQSWSPSGATWYYTHLTVFLDPSYIKITYTGDTLVGSDTLKKLEKYRIGYSYPFSSYFSYHYGTNLTKEVDSIVYLYNTDSAAFDTLYNFKAHPGDHWRALPDIGCNATVNVLGTGVRNIHGQNLKWLYVKTTYDSSPDFGYAPTTDTIYQKMGPRSGIETNDYCKWDTYDGNETGPFRCYSDDAFGTYTVSVHPCDYIMSETDLQNPDKHMDVFPNPFQGNSFSVNNPSSAQQVYVLKDFQGKTIQTGILIPGSNTINTGTVNSGLYFFLVSGNQAVKLIKE